MQDYGLVSIITPNYNCGRFVAQTIESVLAQTYQNWELLIQDDCSTDDSMAVALQYAERDVRIKVERNSKNVGAAITRNRAIERSQGQWLAFLDSDDLWLPEKLERQLAFMTHHHCDFSYTRYEHIDEAGNSLHLMARAPKRLTYNGLLRHCWPGCLTVMYRQDVDNKIFAQDVKKNNDHALFLRVMRRCGTGMGMNECLALYRIRKGSISRNKWAMVEPFVKVVHEFEGKSLLKAYWCVFTHLFVKTFIKYEKINNNKSLSMNILPPPYPQWRQKQVVSPWTVSAFLDESECVTSCLMAA